MFPAQTRAGKPAIPSLTQRACRADAGMLGIIGTTAQTVMAGSGISGILRGLLPSADADSDGLNMGKQP
jgi:hypothetical protein